MITFPKGNVKFRGRLLIYKEEKGTFEISGAKYGLRPREVGS